MFSNHFCIRRIKWSKNFRFAICEWNEKYWHRKSIWKISSDDSSFQRFREKEDTDSSIYYSKNVSTIDSRSDCMHQSWFVSSRYYSDIRAVINRSQSRLFCLLLIWIESFERLHSKSSQIFIRCIRDRSSLISYLSWSSCEEYRNAAVHVWFMPIKCNWRLFDLVDLQTDDSLILANSDFAASKEFHLQKAKLMIKEREKLISDQSMKFNEELIRCDLVIELIHLNQKKLCQNLQLIALKSMNLISSKDMIRKSVISNDQYVGQRARNAYIASLTQFEVSFDLSSAAQVISSKKEDVMRLNKRLSWQIDNPIRELKFLSLNIAFLRIVIFIDASFINRNQSTFFLSLTLAQNYSSYISQINYVICLIDANNRINILHWFFTKCKGVIRFVLASKLFAMIHEFDVETVLRFIIEFILNSILFMMICIDV